MMSPALSRAKNSFVAQNLAGIFQTVSKEEEKNTRATIIFDGFFFDANIDWMRILRGPSNESENKCAEQNNNTVVSIVTHE